MTTTFYILSTLLRWLLYVAKTRNFNTEKTQIEVFSHKLDSRIWSQKYRFISSLSTLLTIRQRRFNLTMKLKPNTWNCLLRIYIHDTLNLSSGPLITKAARYPSLSPINHENVHTTRIAILPAPSTLNPFSFQANSITTLLSEILPIPTDVHGTTVS